MKKLILTLMVLCTISVYVYADENVLSHSEQKSISNVQSLDIDNNIQTTKRIWQFTPYQKRYFGFTVGWITKQKKIKDGSFKYKGSYLLGEEGKLSHGLRLGFVANPTFKYGLGFRTGFMFEYCYEQIDEEESISAEDVKYHDFAFSNPLQISYRMMVAKELSLMLYSGPVLDYELCQTVKEGTETTDYLYDDFDDLHGFNCLWGIGGGLQYKFLRFEMGGEFGLIKKSGFRWNKPVYMTLSLMF